MTVSVDADYRLPTSLTGPAYAIDAEALPAGDAWWGALQGATRRALHFLQRDHAIDGAAWFCAITRPEGEHPQQVGVVFAFEDEATPEIGRTLLQALRSTSPAWSQAGVRAIPRRAFPSLGQRGDALYQLWVEGRSGLRAPRLQYEEGEVLQTRVGPDADPEAFLDEALHAVGSTAEREPAHEATPLDTFKLVFALNVCERIVESDGALDEAEIEFLRRVFPRQRLESLGLDDRIRFLRLRHRAPDVLAQEMEHDDKMALMGLFWRAGQSDGSVSPAEIQILRDAAGQLHLDWPQVEAYLGNIW